MGCILFIDEAYSLTYSGSGEDYGQELGEIFKSLCDKFDYMLMKCDNVIIRRRYLCI